MFAATYIRYIVQRISNLLYTRHPVNTSLVVPLLSDERGAPSASSATPRPVEPKANHIFWKEEEQRQLNQESKARPRT
jgi:hypothetical protein